jgi:YHS domain-containing protein
MNSQFGRLAGPENAKINTIKDTTMRMRKLILMSLGGVTLLVAMVWITAGGAKAGAQSTKEKSVPATCPMAKADKATCPAMKEGAMACEQTTCSDEQTATCSTEMTCPMMGAAAGDPAKPAIENAVSADEQKTCPIKGKPINKEVFTTYKGKRVYFCCANCKAEFEKNPEKYLDKLPQFK